MNKINISIIMEIKLMEYIFVSKVEQLLLSQDLILLAILMLGVVIVSEN